jgi:hypothetical protein
MEKEMGDFFLEGSKTFEDLMKDIDEDELWKKYMEDHLKEEEECRKRANLKRQKKGKIK